MARIIIEMKCSPHHLVEIVDGLPGEEGSAHLVPSHRLYSSNKAA